VSSDRDVLSSADAILLPGVGAFPAAMAKLHAHDLVGFLQDRARGGQPFVGICLGMQLMADASVEHGATAGLGLIPGEVTPFRESNWHIGWNTIEAVGDDPMVRPSDGKSVYFNHSYIFDAPIEYQLCRARLTEPFVVGVRRGNLVGLQFHPEKSQDAGREMLKNVIEGLCA
jgi:glutamine amidotransferase